MLLELGWMQMPRLAMYRAKYKVKGAAQVVGERQMMKVAELMTLSDEVRVRRTGEERLHPCSDNSAAKRVHWAGRGIRRYGALGTE